MLLAKFYRKAAVAGALHVIKSKDSGIVVTLLPDRGDLLS